MKTESLLNNLAVYLEQEKKIYQHEFDKPSYFARLQ